jgi:hypothetical protein
MTIVGDIKNTVRKAANSVIDTSENIVDKPKTPKELAKRLIEHLTHQEYNKIAEILSDEARKYALHMGIADFSLVETKLNDFRNSMEDLAADLEEKNFKAVANKIKQINDAVPEEIAGISGVFTSLKSLLQDITKVLEEYAHGIDAKSDNNLDFSKLQQVFEDHLNKMMSKNK